MGNIGNRYLQGEPILPYQNVIIEPGTDVFFDLTFLDHTLTLVTPTSITIEIDDITNSIVMNGPTALNSGGSQAAPFIYSAFASAMTLQVSASVWQASYPYEGSQKCQIVLTFTAIDTVTGQPFTKRTVLAVLQQVGVATVSGQ